MWHSLMTYLSTHLSSLITRARARGPTKLRTSQSTVNLQWDYLAIYNLQVGMHIPLTSAVYNNNCPLCRCTVASCWFCFDPTFSPLFSFFYTLLLFTKRYHCQSYTSRDKGVKKSSNYHHFLYISNFYILIPRLGKNF